MPDIALEDTGEKPVTPTGREGGGIELPSSADLAARIDTMLRILASISDTAPEEGVTRLAFTPTERAAHDVVAGWFDEIGLTVRQDVAGNTIAEDAGTDSLQAIGTGSHLDSVPRGGRFDGIAGVVASVAVAQMLKEQGISHTHPFRFVVFAGEEGARFGQPCIGSKAVAGLWQPEHLDEVTDAEGVSLAEAMRLVGLEPGRIAEASWRDKDWGAFVELHVEQGAVLETQGSLLGIVDLISGSTRFEIDVAGRASHSGSTPMSLRADALSAAAEITLVAEELANDSRHRGTRCTVGKLTVFPGSITTIPGRAVVHLDVRDVDSARQRQTANQIVRRAELIAERRGVTLEVRLRSDTSPVVLPTWIRQVITEACQEHTDRWRVMSSGASHDTQLVNTVIPSGLLFVPSRGGLSHVPEEWSSAADIARGSEVLLNALLKLDAHPHLT